jgi:hypothetical protein
MRAAAAGLAWPEADELILDVAARAATRCLRSAATGEKHMLLKTCQAQATGHKSTALDNLKTLKVELP